MLEPVMNISEKRQFLASQPRPRLVRLSRRGKSWVRLLASILAAVEIGLLVFLLTRAIRANPMATAASSNGIALYSALLLPFLPVMFSRGLGKGKELIRNGEVAVATVTFTSNSPSLVNRNDDVRTVRYQFRDKSGALVEGSWWILPSCCANIQQCWSSTIRTTRRSRLLNAPLTTTLSLRPRCRLA
jgi:hypothetical protein